MAFCSSCGAKLNEGVKFCQDCGKQVNMESNGNAQTAATVQTPSASSDSIALMAFGYISAFIGLFFIPPLFGGIGVFLGYLLKKRNDVQGRYLMIASGAAIIIGFMFGFLAAPIYY